MKISKFKMRNIQYKMGIGREDMNAKAQRRRDEKNRRDWG